MAERLLQIPGYRLLRRLQQDASVTTYLAQRGEGNQRAVVKVFTRPRVRQSDFNDSFQRQCLTLSQLKHPNILRFYDGGVQKGSCYLVLEHVEGAERIDEWSVDAPQQLLPKLAELARALHFAHGRGCVHGAIEAARVLIQDGERILLTGFEERLMPTVSPVGASLYLAPECRDGAVPDPASDVYSLGMLFYCLLARRAPEAPDFVVGKTLKSVADGVPSLPGHLRVFQPLINRSLAPDPGRRYTADIFADAIEQVTAEDLETIRIATPHYLASLANSRVDDLELPADEAGLDAANVAANEEQAMKVAHRGRARIFPMFLAAAAGALGATAVAFWDRVPMGPELMTWTESRWQMAEACLLQLAGNRQTSSSAGAASSPAEANVPAAAFVESGEGNEQFGFGGEHASTAEKIEIVPAAEAVDYELAAGRLRKARELVEEGDHLLAQDALTVPPEANALAAYQQALVLDPHNERAWAGLQNIARRYIQLARARLDSGELTAAAEFVRRGLTVEPNSQELLALHSRLNSLLDAPPDSAEVERLTALARRQMARENYIAPAGDSAYDHYSRLLLLEPDNPEARSALARIERDLAGEIELQVNRNRFDQAQTLLVQARDAFPASQRFHRLTLELEAAIQFEQDRRASSAPP